LEGRERSQVQQQVEEVEGELTPRSGIVIHFGKYSVKDYQTLKPFEKAKVKQLFEDTKKKDTNKFNLCNVAVMVTQEDAPLEEDKGI
jgi:hypothetical protein